MGSIFQLSISQKEWTSCPDPTAIDIWLQEIQAQRLYIGWILPQKVMIKVRLSHTALASILYVVIIVITSLCYCFIHKSSLGLPVVPSICSFHRTEVVFAEQCPLFAETDAETICFSSFCSKLDEYNVLLSCKRLFLYLTVTFQYQQIF